jgi:DNA-binding beta-propeller fold protein YncE
LDHRAPGAAGPGSGNHLGKGTPMIRIALVAFLATAAPPQEGAKDAAPYTKMHKIAVGGEGGWDYLTVDPDAQRLYVSRGDRIVVIDTANEKVVGEVTGTPGVHGAAVVPDLNLGFTSNGQNDTVTAFDLKTLKATGTVKVGSRPDAIMYDPSSKNVFTFNHGSKDATAVDPAGMKVAGTVTLEGVPEAAQPDGNGHVFVNLMDKSEVVEFDANSFRVLNRWPLAPGQRPTGLAFDRANRRLFSACGANQKMIVLDADNGKVVAALDIGQGADGCVFDAERKLAFAPNGRDGTLTVVKQEGPDQYRVAATVPSQRGARTMTLDPRSHRLYLSTATFEAPPPGTPKEQPKTNDQPKTKGRRPNMVPGSFVVLVVGE